jgi:O-antigen ligase
MAILLLAVAALVPLLIAPGVVLFHDVTPKVAVLLAGTSIAAVWFVISPRASSQPLLSTRPGRWLAAILALQLIALVISTAVSTRPTVSLTGTTWRRFGLLTQSALLAFTWLFAAAATRPGFILQALRMAAAAGSIAALYGIAQYFGIDPLLDSSAYRVGEGIWMIVRPPSTLGHANYAGIIYLHSVFAGAALVLTGSWRWDRLLGTAAAIAGSLAILCGGSRAALLGLAAGAVILAVARRWRPRIRHATIGAAVVAALAIFYFTPPGERMRARVKWFIDDPRGGARPMLWTGSLEMAAQRPLAGWGLETFSAEFPRFQPESLSVAYPDFYHESAHSIFLDALASQGLPGMLLLLALCAVACWSALNSPDRDRGAALLAALGAVLVALQFNALTLPAAVVLYSLAALSIAAAAGNSTPDSIRVSPLRWLAVVGAVPWLAFAAILTVWDVQLAAVDRSLRAGKLDDARSAWNSATRAGQRAGLHAELWYSRRLLSFAQSSPQLLTRAAAIREALTIGDVAAYADDPHNAWYHFATLYALSGNTQATEASLRAAIDAAPRWFKPRWTLARLLLLTGRPAEARAQADLAEQLGGSKYPEVVQTLAEVRAAATQK